MEALPEVIITASSTVSVYDVANGNVIACYKESNIAPKTLSLIGEDYLIGAVRNEPKIRVWTVSKWKHPETGSFICRGIVTALTVTSCGTYCVGGIKEEIHIWKVSTGMLLNIVTRHYREISCLRFSSDDSHLISGGKDGHVVVWILSQIIDVNTEKDQAEPRHVWNHHASEVTDIYPGSLGCVARVVTTSLDTTCKIYEMDSGMLLSTICMDVPLTSVVMDGMEYYVYLGTSSGSIFKINTYDRLPRELHLTNVEKIECIAHDQRVISLSMTCDGEKLMSASDDKTCKLWNAASMSCLVTLSLAGGITNAFLSMKPTALPSDDVRPQFVVQPFKRDFDDYQQRNLRIYTESKATTSPLTLKNLATSFPFYSELLRVGEVKVAKKLNIPEEKHFEYVYQDALHGQSVDQLKLINNQMYSYLINHGLDSLPHDLSD